jgi:hypothetical protein
MTNRPSSMRRASVMASMSSCSLLAFRLASPRWKTSWSVLPIVVCRKGDEAALLGRQRLAGPHLAEEHLVGETDECRGEVAEHLRGSGRLVRSGIWHVRSFGSLGERPSAWCRLQREKPSPRRKGPSQIKPRERPCLTAPA